MKVLNRFLAAVALASPLMAPATAIRAQDKILEPVPPPAVGGPMQLLYVIPGIRDDGGAAEAGVATTFHCSNTSQVTETIQVVVRTASGTIVGNDTANVLSARTRTISTHATVVFSEDVNLNTGFLGEGLAFIFGTSQFIFCSAKIMEASAGIPWGVSLHMVRFAPLAGTQE